MGQYVTLVFVLFATLIFMRFVTLVFMLFATLIFMLFVTLSEGEGSPLSRDRPSGLSVAPGFRPRTELKPCPYRLVSQAIITIEILRCAQNDT